MKSALTITLIGLVLSLVAVTMPGDQPVLAVVGGFLFGSAGLHAYLNWRYPR